MSVLHFPNIIIFGRSWLEEKREWWGAQMAHLRKNAGGHLLKSPSGHLVNCGTHCTSCTNIIGATIVVSGTSNCSCHLCSNVLGIDGKVVGTVNKTYSLGAFGVSGNCQSTITDSTIINHYLSGGGCVSGGAAAPVSITLSYITASTQWSFVIGGICAVFAGTFSSATLCTDSSFTINNTVTCTTGLTTGGSASVVLTYA